MEITIETILIFCNLLLTLGLLVYKIIIQCITNGCHSDCCGIETTVNPTARDSDHEQDANEEMGNQFTIPELPQIHAISNIHELSNMSERIENTHNEDMDDTFLDTFGPIYKQRVKRYSSNRLRRSPAITPIYVTPPLEKRKEEEMENIKRKRSSA